MNVSTLSLQRIVVRHTLASMSQSNAPTVASPTQSFYCLRCRTAQGKTGKSKVMWDSQQWETIKTNKLKLQKGKSKGRAP